jgi:hypothetical protein
LFSTNPLTLLDVNDEEWLILIACAKVIESDRLEQQKKAQENRGGSSRL